MKKLGTKKLLLGSFAATFGLLTACSNQPTTFVPKDAPSSIGMYLNLDEQFSEVAKELPAFAGLYINEDGQYVVNMATSDRLQTTRLDDVRGAIEGVFGPSIFDRARVLRINSTEDDIQIESVEYSWDQLTEWFEDSLELVQAYGVASLDIDEVQNHVTIGLIDESRIGPIRDALRKYNVPDEAVTLEIAGLINELQKSVRHRQDPAYGGTQIQMIINGEPAQCTLGFNVSRNGELGFLVNSHCTRSMGFVDGVRFFQNSAGNSSHAIGVETLDPPFLAGTGSCPLGFHCRKSDAAYAKYGDPNNSGRGKIPFIDQTPNNLYYSKPRTVTNSTADPLAGELLDKIGRSTGWSRATVQKTCAGYIKGGGRWVTCQFSTRAISNNFIASDNGDSGSPVYAVKSGTAAPRGILWGEDPTMAYDYILSPIGGIEQDLGNLDFAP